MGWHVLHVLFERRGKQETYWSKITPMLGCSSCEYDDTFLRMGEVGTATAWKACCPTYCTLKEALHASMCETTRSHNLTSMFTEIGQN